MLIAAMMAAFAGEPILGPLGWSRPGPLPDLQDEGARGRVTVDPRTCSFDIFHLDLDAGPENRDLRLARVWDVGWRWADDWRIIDGRLFRPGRDPAPLSGTREFQGYTLEVDATGRVTSRSADGRKVEILREPDGTFLGMRSNGVDVRIDEQGTTGRSSSGQSVRWRWDGPRLTSVATARTTTLYFYEDDQLSLIRWSDGGAISLSTRLADDGSTVTRASGLGGDWTCQRSASRTVLRGPSGSWIFTRTAETEAVLDPSGATTRTAWRNGWLIGWTDPRGGETHLTRDGFGRLTVVEGPDGARTTLGWRSGALISVETPTGGSWTIERDARGAITELRDPVGRLATWEWDNGRVRAVRIGASRAALARDAQGRVVTITDPAGSKVEISRGPSGSAASVKDAGGGRWTLTRAADDSVSKISDPTGQSWNITHDTLGRISGIGGVRWTVRDDGRPGRVDVGDGAWDLLWSTGLSAVRDPLGAVTGFVRDALGRVAEVHRPDGEVIHLRRDPAGDIVGADALTVLRDTLGRPLSMVLGDRKLAWDRDPAGQVVGVSAPGTQFTIGRDRSGVIQRIASQDGDIALDRDGQGRVIRATTARGSTTVIRDAAGRIMRMQDDERTVIVDRDVRGLETRIQIGDKTWSIGRDAAGRELLIDGPGARLGVDRGVDGQPSLVRLTNGALAQFFNLTRERVATVSDRDGRALAKVGWARDKAGRVERVTTSVPPFTRATTSTDFSVVWLLRRDPVGRLVAAESDTDAWSVAPDHLDQPGDRVVQLVNGRPLSASDASGWGLGTGEHRYEIQDDAVVSVSGPSGRARITYDAIGQLTSWLGPGGEQRIDRDAFGRLVRVGNTPVSGWKSAITVGHTAYSVLTSIGFASPDGGALLGPFGPLFRTGGPESVAGDQLAQGWYSPGGGPLLSLTDARDPVSGLSLGAQWRFLWDPVQTELSTSASPWSSPDGSATPPWDPGPWAPDSPWADPVALLSAHGDLPTPGPRASRSPGLPWLPSSLAPAVPLPLVDPGTLPVDEEPLVRWILAHAQAPTTPAGPNDLPRAILGDMLAEDLRVPPGLLPRLPEALQPL